MLESAPERARQFGIGAALGGAVGLIAGPFGYAAGAATGAAVGAYVAHRLGNVADPLLEAYEYESSKHWQANDAVSECRCARAFTAVLRRHHCRK